MTRIIRKKFMAIILTLALVISLMPTVTLPASAAFTTPDITLNDTEVDTEVDLTLNAIFETTLTSSTTDGAGYTIPMTESGNTTGASIYLSTPGDYDYNQNLFIDGNTVYKFKASSAGTYQFTASYDTGNVQSGTRAVQITVNGGNTAPTASSVSVGGTAQSGQTLTGDYTYYDADSDNESGTVYKWYRADDDSGTNEEALSGATAITYTLTGDDVGKYVCFEVTPSDGADSGTEVKSSYTGPVTAADSDTTPPVSPAYSPANNETDVAVDVMPTLTFGEALYCDASGTVMDAAPTGVIMVYEGTSSSGTALDEGTDFTVAYNSLNYKFTVTFEADLKYSQSCYVELQANKVYDAAGNAINSAEGVSFTTVGAAVKADFTVSSPVGVALGNATLTGGKYYYESAEVAGDDIRTILISFSENVDDGDEIRLPTQEGFTVSDTSNKYTKRINLAEGTSTDAVQDYLRNVGFTIAGASQTVSVTVTTENITTDTFYNIDTEHYYQYIPAGSSGITWTDAYTYAKDKTYMGRSGYLATVRDLEEDTYLNSLSGDKTGWLGGTILKPVTLNGLYYDSFEPTSFVSDGWYWACGPEIGNTFYNKNSLKGLSISDADNENSALGYYFNWGRGDEPNNTNGGENCLTTLVISSKGKQNTSFSWNDISYDNTDQSSTYSAKGYFVEYGDKLKGDNGSGSTTFASDSGTLNKVYTITYNLNGGTNPSGTPVSYTCETGATLPMPTKTGFTFGGWYASSNFSGSKVTSISTSDTGAKEYWAMWTEAAYDITYNLNGGTNPDGAPTGYTYGTGATLPTPTRTDFTFGGWYDNSSFTGYAVTMIGKTDTGAKQYWAMWMGAAYTITYNLNGGTNPSGAPANYTYGTGATLPMPTKTDFTFGGWYDNSNFTGSAVTTIGTTDTGTKEYWAMWTEAAYIITYNLNGGANPDGAPTGYTYGTGATLPAPTRTDFTFGGWYDNASFTGSAVTMIGTTDTGNKTYYAKWTVVASSDGNSPSRTITVTETSSDLFAGSSGAVLAEANMNNAFYSSVEVKVTDTDQEGASFGFGAGTDVYPFDISLYIKGTNTKTKPESGYAVTISLPIPEDFLDVREKLFVVHKSDDGTITTLTSILRQINGVWYLVFDAAEFSPYALVVRNSASNNTAAGLPYYLNSSGGKVFIGFAADGKYLAPDGVTVLFTPNPQNFSDISTHWGKTYIDFVTEREIFVGTGDNMFSPDTGMTRAMFATVIGRLYERSYGEIIIPDVRAFTDCDYDDYYGKYVDWAAENGIILGYGNNRFGPDDQITREQMAVILYQFARFLGVLPSDMDAALAYPDSAIISSWAENAALYCQQTGIITGRDGGNFVPQGTATRAEVATILERFVENTLD